MRPDADKHGLGHDDDEGADVIALWPDPDLSLLDNRRGDDLPAFPIDVFSPRWQAFLERAAHGAAVAIDHVAIPLLSTSSSMIGAARRVRASPGWSEPITLWTGVIGWSGTGKTPGLDVSRRALANIERARRPSVEAARIANQERAALAKVALKRWQAAVAKAMKDGIELPPRPKEADTPEPFVAPRFFVSDVTPARVAPLLQARPRGILAICDELAGLFINMRRFAARAFWLESWCGGPFIVERANRPSVSVPHLLVGVCGGLQPDKLNAAFAGDQDGLHARILFGWPAEPGYRVLATEGAEIEPDFQEALLRLITLDARAAGAEARPAVERQVEHDEADGDDLLTIESGRAAPKPGDLEGLLQRLASEVGSSCDLVPKELVLSVAAKAEFEAFRQRLHTGKEALDGLEREWWAKGGGNVLRLAGTLAYLAWAMPEPAPATPGNSAFQAILQAAEAAQEPTEVSAEFMRSAVRLWESYFWPHARAALRQVGLTDRHRDARRVLTWARANRKTPFSRDEARREALGKRLDAKQTKQVLDRLVEAGWLRRHVEETRGRPAHRWHVNPALWGESAFPADTE